MTDYGKSYSPEPIDEEDLPAGGNGNAANTPPGDDTGGTPPPTDDGGFSGEVVVSDPVTNVDDPYQDGPEGEEFYGIVPPEDTGPTAEDELRASLEGQGYDQARIDQLIGPLMGGATAGSITAAQAPAPGQISAGSISAGKAKTVKAADPTKLEHTDMDGLIAAGSGVEIGDTSVHQREVQDNELVSEHLNNLLDSNSRYITAAKNRAIELANKRGQFGSSFMAGAAERAAIESALPIAQGDAQAFRDAATQNLNALNEMSLANLQRATQLDVALLDSNTRKDIANLDAETRTNLGNLDAATRIELGNLDASTRTNIANLDAKTRTNIANLDAETRISMANLDAMTATNIANLDANTKVSIANMTNQTQLGLGQLQAEMQLAMQDRELNHSSAMEIYRQDGRVELANLDIEARTRLQEAGFSNDFDMSNLSHEQQLEVNSILQKYQQERDADDQRFQSGMQYANMMTQAQANYINYLTAYAGTDMDANAAARLEQNAWDNLLAETSLINALFPDQEPIIPQRHTGG